MDVNRETTLNYVRSPNKFDWTVRWQYVLKYIVRLY